MKFLIIFFKELADTLRDRRTLFSGFAYGLLGPVAIAFMVNMVAASSRDDALQSVALCGKGAAPGLLQHLTAAGITFASDGKVCLNVPANYAERMAQGRPAHLVISADLTANGQTARKLETEIKSYGSSLAQQRRLSPSRHDRSCLDHLFRLRAVLRFAGRRRRHDGRRARTSLSRTAAQ
jgi:sodium transport system permease protein